MKSMFTHLLLLMSFVIFLLFPIQTLNGAASGLLLWYNVVLPTLFPFIVITTLIVSTGAYDIVSRLMGPMIRSFFAVGEDGAFVIIIGFLCGYPMGAKMINDLYSQGRLSKNEASYLLSFCNNTSPMFIISFFIYQTLANPELLLPSILAIYLAPVIVSFFTRHIYLKNSVGNNVSYKITSVPRVRISFQLIDTTILDSITLILKIGGYMILFSVIINLSNIGITSIPLLAYIIPLLEVTNGITMYHQLASPILSYVFMIFLISFGGFCAVAQTQCVLADTDIKITHYFLQKIITAIIAVIINVCILFISHRIPLIP